MDFNIQPNKNKKGKHGGHASKPNAKKSTSARKITLKDEIPSAIAVRVECHKILWAMVSLTSGIGPEVSAGDEMGDGGEAQGKEHHNAKKRKTRSRFGINDNVSESVEYTKGTKYVRDERLSRMTGIILAENDSRDMWYEHIYMMKHSTDGHLYPARVEGAGPSSYSASGGGQRGSNDVTALMSFLGNPKVKFEVPRSVKYLILPTKDDMLHVKKLYHEKYCDLPGVDALLAPDGIHSKYWDQRYRLFRKFDSGVQLDTESWYSITPEAIGIYLAKKVRNRLLKVSGQHLRVIVDAFSGCGGCAIPLAAISLPNAKGAAVGGERVVAVDTDQDKLDKLMHNAGIYESTSRIQVVCAEVSALLRTLPDLDLEKNSECHEDSSCDQEENWKASMDLIVLSPPWGGPQYLNQRSFDLRKLPECCGCGLKLFQLAASKCLNVAYIIPRNVPKPQLESLARSCLLERGAAEVTQDDYSIEDVYLHGKHKVTILYIGPLFTSSATKSRASRAAMDIE